MYELRKCIVCGNEYPYIKAYFKKCAKGKRLEKYICLSCLKRLCTDKVEEKNKNNNKMQDKNRYINEFKKVRTQVLKRDNNRCVLCGSDNKINVHHIVERSKGGTNDMDNLITLCYDCHKEEHKNEPVYNLMNKAVMLCNFQK